jgi:hypothetical protein
MLTISNIYGHGFEPQRVSRLEALGFRIRPQVSTYMGSQICRFIDFEEGPALEVIEVEDHKEYLDFVPEGMKPYCPGISLIVPEGSNAAIGDFERRFRHLDPYTLHVNYDGSQVHNGPGWNYLNFKIPVVPDTFIWLTAFDQPPPTTQYETVHPNTITGLAGLVFDLDVEQLKGLSQLVNESFTAGAMKVGDVQVWSRNAITDFPTLRPKAFPLTAILLKAQNLDTFAAYGDRVRQTSFMTQPAVLIETSRLAWDLIVVAA